MYEYLIHADNGLDDPKLIDGADTLDDARAIAAAALADKRAQWAAVTITDRFGGEHPLVRVGRPPKPEGAAHVRVTITLPPETLSKLDTLGDNRSGTIARLIDKA
ncbi:MAG: hypothetical protein RL268_301 [Pseudomonadota bacterium]|jgi:hypothetical protein